MLVEGPPKLARQRLLEFLVQHLQGYREGMAGPHRPGYELEALRELPLELPQAGGAFAQDEQQRQRTGGQGRRQRQMAAGGKAVPDRREDQKKERQAGVYHAGGAPLQAGLIEQVLQPGIHAQAREQA